jgi:hypothetical protein
MDLKTVLNGAAAVAGTLNPAVGMLPPEKRRGG